MKPLKDQTSREIIDRLVQVIDQVKARYEMRYDADFALELGIQNMTLSRWRYRAQLPSAIDLYRIARKYGANTDWIVTGRGAAFPTERVDERRMLSEVLREVRKLREDISSSVIRIGTKRAHSS